MTRLQRIVAVFLAAAFGAMAAEWRQVPREVLSFYYGWYGNPQVSQRWVHWRDVDEANKRIGSSTHWPSLGPYDCHDPKLIEQHFRWAKQAGLTGFIVTWWVQGDFHDQGLRLLLDTARKHRLKITIYYETVPPRDKPAPGGAVKDLLYLLARYGKHPAWLKLKGKPVFFIYGRAVNQIKLDGWKQVIADVNGQYRGGAVFVGDRISEEAVGIFDGIHTYNPTGRTAGKSADEIRAWARETYPQWVRTAGNDRIACLTVIPGYDDTKLKERKPPRPTTDRHGGQTYHILWEEAIAANPDWVLITSWNEWHEGSEIEPSLEDGEQALKTTAEFAPKFLRRPRRR